MKVMKKINNNVAICLDNNNHELIAFGRGIGFAPCPYELSDLNIIKRTYYGVDRNYLALIDDISEDIFELSALIVDAARAKIDCEFSNNLIFTLADHINFAIERFKKNMNIRNPLLHDIQHLYENEMMLGEMAVKLINKELKLHMPKDEAGNIAMHFINAEAMEKQKSPMERNDSVIKRITLMIEEHFNLQIDQDGFNYSRFLSHLQYLLKRSEAGKEISSENLKLYRDMKESFPKSYECVLEISKYLEEEIAWDGNEEELLYLILHVNRLCAREDCNH